MSNISYHDDSDAAFSVAAEEELLHLKLVQRSRQQKDIYGARCGAEAPGTQ